MKGKYGAIALCSATRPRVATRIRIRVPLYCCHGLDSQTGDQAILNYKADGYGWLGQTSRGFVAIAMYARFRGEHHC